MKIITAFVVILLTATPASATFSIVAFDPVTGDLGVAVASRVFGVGNHVPWAEAGVGAVATQAAMNLDPNAYKATMDSALSAPATVAYRKVMQDAAFAAQLPQ